MTFIPQLDVCQYDDQCLRSGPPWNTGTDSYDILLHDIRYRQMAYGCHSKLYHVRKNVVVAAAAVSLYSV